MNEPTKRLNRILACAFGSLWLIAPVYAAEMVLLEPKGLVQSNARIETAWLSAVAEETSIRLTPVPCDACHVLSIRPKAGLWNLSRYRFVEFALTNSGKYDIEFTL